MAIDMLIRKKWDKFSLDINFKSQSKRIGILGASGCGKSMTLKSIDSKVWSGRSGKTLSKAAFRRTAAKNGACSDYGL